MSAQAPETPTTRAGSASRGGTARRPAAGGQPPAGGGKKIGGMPVWAVGAGVVIVGGGIIYYLINRKKNAAATAATGTTAGTAGTATNQAGQISTLQTEIGDLQGAESGEGTGTTVQPPPPPPPPPPGGGGGGGGGPHPIVSVPRVTGERANFAIGQLTSVGLHYKAQPRNPKHEYVVASQSPGAGAHVAKGSTVTLAWRQIK